MRSISISSGFHAACSCRRARRFSSAGLCRVNVMRFRYAGYQTTAGCCPRRSTRFPSLYA
ncbi:hypothetical protein KCP76_02905 [Salmonella enterica subsp. enterica serovar Weltevreden]|nr:hypothetical protein KCP76_02905 [Salmonella enterica subsp. enterica serovar Weltevreden]